MVGNSDPLGVEVVVFPGDCEPVGVSRLRTEGCGDPDGLSFCVREGPGASEPSRRAQAIDAWKRGSS